MQTSSPLKVILWDSGSTPSFPLCTMEQINEALLRPGPGFLTYFPGLCTYVPSWRCWTTWAAWLGCKCCFMLSVVTRTQKQSGENNCSQTFTFDGCVGFVSSLHLLFFCTTQVRRTSKQINNGWFFLNGTDPSWCYAVMIKCLLCIFSTVSCSDQCSTCSFKTLNSSYFIETVR